MSIVAEHVTDRQRTDESAETYHLVCCCTDHTIGACGWDCSSYPWSESDDDLVCAVCEDLWPDGADCPLCGCGEC